MVYLFSRHLGHFMERAKPALKFPEFDIVCKLITEKVVPRLLPLQSYGRSIKPCLLHGECWDGNTALDMNGAAFIFDVCPFYGHNEYDIGDCRPERHAMSRPEYRELYKHSYKPSESSRPLST